MLNSAALNTLPLNTLASAEPPVDTSIVAHTRVVVTAEVGAGPVVCPTVVWVSSSGISEAPVHVQVLDTLETSGRWSAYVAIDGVDWSGYCVGTVTIDAEEGAARVASFTIRPPAGPINPSQWTGRSVVIDLVRIPSTIGYASRAFTGYVEMASYNPNTREFALECTDGLQLDIAKMSREDIDTLTGAVYHKSVMGEPADNWDYAQMLMETRTASLDKSRFGAIRVTPWDGLDTWDTFGSDTLLDASLDIDLLRRSELINEVAVESEYRYFLCRERGDALVWSQLNFLSYAFQKTGFTRPTRDMVAGAIEGTGWHVKSLIVLPPHYDISKYTACGLWMESVDAGGSIGTVYRTIPFDEISGFVAYIGLRYAQTITEYSRMVVRAPQSIAANGIIPSTVTVATASEWDSSKWESWDEMLLYPEYDPISGAYSGSPISTTPSGGTGLFELEYAPDADRLYAQSGQEVAIAKAVTSIRASHRKGVVSASLDCRPEIDLHMRLGVSTPTLEAEAKVSQVVHTLNIDEGTAITEFRIALSGIASVGVAEQSSLVAPDPVDTGIPADTWSTPYLGTYYPDVVPYSENLNGHLINPPESVSFTALSGCEATESYAFQVDTGGTPYPFSGFRVFLPGVDDTHRDAKIASAETEYTVSIPVDPLTLTV